MFKTIVVPLDGSPLSEQVLPKAAELAKCFPDAKFVLLEVIKPLAPSVIDAMVLSNSSEVETLTPGEAMDYLRQVAARYFPGLHVRIMAEEAGRPKSSCRRPKTLKPTLSPWPATGGAGSPGSLWAA